MPVNTNAESSGDTWELPRKKYLEIKYKQMGEA